MVFMCEIFIYNLIALGTNFELKCWSVDTELELTWTQVATYFEVRYGALSLA